MEGVAMILACKEFNGGQKFVIVSERNISQDFKGISYALCLA